jgi:predicted ABC-type ATPase
MDKNLYIIAGCNGAGKTTASFTILPEIIDCKEFVNADEIARGLSPFQFDKVALEAGRIMLHRINELISHNKTFAFETTLASKTYKNKIIEAKRLGYTIHLIFFWLEEIELAKKRVQWRVYEGGHSIPDDVIERRYRNGIQNLFRIYLPLVDSAIIINNSFGKYELIAEKSNQELIVINKNDYLKLKKYFHDYC